MSIRFEKVSKKFGSKVVLDHLSFEVSTGEILFILGKSGVGKSVTLKHIVGLLKPDEGKITVDGKEVTSLSEDSPELGKIRSSCGMVFQHPALLDSLTVFENVAFGLRKKGVVESQIQAKVAEKLKLVHLDPVIASRMPNEISYGMQKRVALARTLAPEPRYLLFDEPTTGLDPITTNAVNDLIYELSRELKVTSIVVSHDMGCALKIADRILVLDQGKILAMDGVEAIKASREPLIMDFLSETLSVKL